MVARVGGLVAAEEDVAEAMAYQSASRQPQAAARGSAIRLRFSSIPDVSSALTILRIEGAMLEPKQILELARLIEEAGEVRAALNLAGEKYPRLAAQVAATADPRPILRDVRGKVLADGSVADDASVALHRLRRESDSFQSGATNFVDCHGTCCGR